MQDLNDLYYFVQVVEAGGFAAAARRLGMPRSRLSRRIGLLEDRLGVRLIQRSTRRFQVTEIGREYHRHCVAMLVEAEAAQDAIDRRHARPRGIVRVTCPTTLLHFQVGAMIARFMAACPEVELHLEGTNRRVDLIGEGVDLAFRVRFPPLEDSGLVMRELGPSPQRIVAAPSLLAGSGRPATPAELAGLPSLGWHAGREEYAWHLRRADGAQAAIHHRPRFLSEDMESLRQAALAGIGVVQLPSMVVDDDLGRGALVELVPGWAPREGLIHLVFPTRRGLLPATRAFIDHVAREYEALADPAPAPGRPPAPPPGGRTGRSRSRD
ncbi:LysR substrate-binding domain-containing protein [Roseomonas sp. OT10]|uniref:LysR substrate-binding domain-containing protein n=1 Tax=Roseomonas cutis TaxID=2897332 RepID=UPI001E45A860|nr:LysR substrate-binding domain-containing protein [Roseomonas sp. OT10]UFN50260.1 LysR substrate-binding domain-containing protein [Roseomonas sp. OT10]